MNFRSILLPLAFAALLVGGAVAAPLAPSSVVNPAPGFAGGSATGKTIKLASLKDKPVLLVIAPSPRDRAFRRQIKELKGHYERLAAQGLIAFVAFTQEEGRVPSNIPFIQVDDASSTAADYGIDRGFAVAVIGRDGNLDCLSTKTLPGQRILDLVVNNAAMQEQLRK